MAAGAPGPVIPSRYVEALDGADPIVSQRKAPKRVKKLIRGLSEKVLARRPAPGKWSIKEVIAHLADGEVILGSRVRFVAEQDRPPLPGYDQDAFVERLAIDKERTCDLLDAFAAVRAVNVRLLERLPKDAFARVGLHAERGEESIEAMVAMYAGHDRIHEQQIEKIKGQLAERKRAKRAKRANDGKSAKKAKEPKASGSKKRAKVRT